MKLPADNSVKIDNFEVEYERFFSVALDMLCISSYDGHFKMVNPAFERVLGFTAEEMCAKSYLDYIHPDDIEITKQEVQKQYLEKQEVFNFENRYRCKDGTYRWLSWKSAPVGEFMYAAARDITETKRNAEEIKIAKESLEIANRELESFSYSVAHDLRAPVRGILGFCNLVIEEKQNVFTPASKVHFDKVVKAAKKMGVLIDGLLNLSRLARKDLTKQSVNISLIAEEVAEELSSSEPHRKVEFVIAKDLMINGDPILLKMAISNLINNAWKYSSKTDRHIKIEFGHKTDGDQRIFFVRDNGAGFDRQYQSKLFGIFQRLHSDQEFEGTGIGLVTVQRILERHGGKIWAEGAVNEGATFYFTA